MTNKSISHYLLYEKKGLIVAMMYTLADYPVQADKLGCTG